VYCNIQKVKNIFEKILLDMDTSHPAHDQTPSDWADMTQGSHFVEFYDGPEQIADSVAKYFVHGLRFGDTCIVAATPKRYQSIEKKMRALYPDLDAAFSAGKFIVLDARETLDRFMEAGGPNPQLFEDVIGGVIRKAAQSTKNIRVFGEMVAILTDEGNAPAAVRLEQLWNKLAEKLSFRLYCAYPKEVLSSKVTSAYSADICSSHSHVVGHNAPAIA
jgi:hypothetical protein